MSSSLATLDLRKKGLISCTVLESRAKGLNLRGSGALRRQFLFKALYEAETSHSVASLLYLSALVLSLSHGSVNLCAS